MTETTPNHTQTVEGWACLEQGGKVTPFVFKRRATGQDDVVIKILYCGMCHTDLHYINNDWDISMYPLVPGKHPPNSRKERHLQSIHTKPGGGLMAPSKHGSKQSKGKGLVIELGEEEHLMGSHVREFKVGDPVGVGCLAASCLDCEHCNNSEENYCSNVQFTYNGIFWDGSITYGGYSKMLVAHKRYVVHVPENLPLDAAAPLLCAGITVYSPMKQHNMIQPGKKLGVVGLGGLGHVAVKFGKAFGLHVTVISTSPAKETAAREHLGADAFIVSKDPKQMQAGARTLDFIIDTVSAPHTVGPILDLLKVRGTLAFVGAPEKPVELPSFPLIFGNRVVSGSMIGGMKETQEMLNVCAKHGITCDVEVIKPEYINTALGRLAKNDIRYRFVIDVTGDEAIPKL